MREMFAFIGTLRLTIFVVPGPSLKRLKELGFNEGDCVRALDACRGDVESAASWLLLNATPSKKAVRPTEAENKSKLSGFEVS